MCVGCDSAGVFKDVVSVIYYTALFPLIKCKVKNGVRVYFYVSFGFLTFVLRHQLGNSHKSVPFYNKDNYTFILNLYIACILVLRNAACIVVCELLFPSLSVHCSAERCGYEKNKTQVTREELERYELL